MVYMAVHDVSRAIVESLAAHYINISSRRGLHRIVNGFSSKWGFPQCMSAIDGSQIPIIVLSENMPTPMWNITQKMVSFCDTAGIGGS